jgi:cytidine deaminase
MSHEPLARGISFVPIDLQHLVRVASEYRLRAYAPHSKFQVGAAVVVADGSIYGGCNIENASFGATVCAERVAIFAAVAAGHQQIGAMAVIADTPEPVSPCGICRQVLAEFAQDDKIVIRQANLGESVRDSKLAELLPLAFRF